MNETSTPDDEYAVTAIVGKQGTSKISMSNMKKSVRSSFAWPPSFYVLFFIHLQCLPVLVSPTKTHDVDVLQPKLGAAFSPYKAHTISRSVGDPRHCV